MFQGLGFAIRSGLEEIVRNKVIALSSEDYGNLIFFLTWCLKVDLLEAISSGIRNTTQGSGMAVGSFLVNANNLQQSVTVISCLSIIKRGPRLIVFQQYAWPHLPIIFPNHGYFNSKITAGKQRPWAYHAHADSYRVT